jgi:hypothetical protein
MNLDGSFGRQKEFQTSVTSLFLFGSLFFHPSEHHFLRILGLVGCMISVFSIYFLRATPGSLRVTK